MKKPGYREMLRDRCPKIVNYALKWQKAKEKWIDHVYSYFIRILVEEIDINDRIVRTAKANKKLIVSYLLGMKKGKIKNFEFRRTIDWDKLSDEETKYWETVSSWVKWFCVKYGYVENLYQNSKKMGRDEETIKIDIINSYLTALMPSRDAPEEEKQAKYDYIDRFVEFLIRCFEGKI